MSSENGHAYGHKFNHGDWLSAKIYSDMKSGCSCKSNEWVNRPLGKGLEEYEVPYCARCGSAPEFYVIVATIKDDDGLVKRVKIRRTQEGVRLSDVIDVTYTLRTVKAEIKSGSFDFTRYESKESRESYKFNLFADEYLGHFERKLNIGEISPAGLKDKKTILKNHLLPYFKDMDIGLITDIKIQKFFNSYEDRLRMRDRATAELKTMLRFAMTPAGGKKIRVLPIFPEIAPAKMVSAEKFIDRETQERIISKIENPIFRAMIRSLAIYALRPSDIRSLKWSNVDFNKGVFHISSHMSLGVDIPGRKSNKSTHTLPITPEFADILLDMKSRLPRVINARDYIFKSVRGGPIAGNTLTRAWNDARKLARVKGVTLYQGTKHSTLSSLAQKASDAQIARLTGHTNTNIVRRYAQANLDQVRELLQ